jgi:hypothetical protein
MGSVFGSDKRENELMVQNAALKARLKRMKVKYLRAKRKNKRLQKQRERLRRKVTKLLDEYAPDEDHYIVPFIIEKPMNGIHRSKTFSTAHELSRAPTEYFENIMITPKSLMQSPRYQVSVTTMHSDSTND